MLPRSLIGPIVLAFIALNLVGQALPLYTDYLWFQEVKFTSVFTTILWYKVALGVIGGLIFALILYLNVRLAARSRAGDVLMELEDPLGLPSRLVIEPLFRRFLLPGALVLGILAGMHAAGQWETVLRFLNTQPFNIQDPLFGRDISFYVFRLPLLETLYGWALAALGIAFLLTVATYVLHRGIQITPRGPAVAAHARAHLLTLAALILIVKAGGYYLDTYHLLLSPTGIVFGAGFSDINASLPALRILAVLALSRPALPRLTTSDLPLVLYGAFLLWCVYRLADAPSLSYGMRNPFRFTFRPGTNEIWVGDVGWSTWEEIDRIVNPTAAPVTNFGWPCYEGNNSGSAIQSGYQSANVNICKNLYNTAGSVVAPYYSYQHGVDIIPGESCATASGSAITGLAFYTGNSYPTAYNGALFFADHSRNCIWVMMPGSNGLPDKTKISNFVTGAANPVDLEIGPGGDLFYVDLEGNTIRRIQYTGAGNQPPVSVIAASPTSGPAPLTVSFDGTGSYDPDAGDGITAYSWDLNGDAIYGGSTSATTSYTYNSPGTYTVSLRVTDKHSATGTSSVVISANNTAPTAVIDTPTASSCLSANPCWAVGDVINFTGHATDPQQGTLPASALQWNIILHHCYSDTNTCHTHQVQGFSGVSSGSFTAPDHDYPAYVEIQLVATDAGGLQNTTSVLLYPKTVNLTLQSNPSGLQLNINGVSGTAPFVHTVIVNSNNSVSAPTPQSLNGVQYTFQSWSDSGAQTHTVLAGTVNATYTATYAPISADLQIVKTGVLSSGKITYTLQVKNNGPAAAQAVAVRDVLPSKVQYLSVSTTQGTCTGGSTVTCQIGTMNSAQSVTVTILVNVTKAAGFITNTATVSASSSTPDLNTANNSSSVQVKAR